jgi:hypothetical protein
MLHIKLLPLTALYILVMGITRIIYTFLDSLSFVEDILSKKSAIKAGAEHLIKMSREQYIDRLTWLKEIYRFDYFRNRITFSKISNLLEELILDNSDGYIRKQPYCVIISGLPGTGKTSFAMKLAAEYMKALHGQFSSYDLVTLNETDDFQSEYRSNHKVVIFDDIAAENPNIAQRNPWRKILDFVNNIKKTALNPNVDLKGNVYILPELVILTTNRIPPYGIPHYMLNHSALFRRFDAQIYLCPEIKGEKYKYLIVKNKDIFKVATSDNACELNTHNYLTSDNLFHRSKDYIDRDDYIFQTIPNFLKHDMEQGQFVDEINSIFTNEIVRKNPFQAFYDDIFYPIVPACLKRSEYPREIYQILSWHEKLLRCFQIPSKEPPMAYAQGESSRVNKKTLNQTINKLSRSKSLSVSELFAFVQETQRLLHHICSVDDYQPILGFCQPDIDFGVLTKLIQSIPSYSEWYAQERTIDFIMKYNPSYILIGREVLFSIGSVSVSIDLLFFDEDKRHLVIVEAKDGQINKAVQQAKLRGEFMREYVPYHVSSLAFTTKAKSIKIVYASKSAPSLELDFQQ